MAIEWHFKHFLWRYTFFEFLPQQVEKELVCIEEHQWNSFLYKELSKILVDIMIRHTFRNAIHPNNVAEQLQACMAVGL